MANLEFANAAPLNCLSLKYWDQGNSEKKMHGIGMRISGFVFQMMNSNLPDVISLVNERENECRNDFSLNISP